MKALVFLLVLANLLFYAFSAGYLGRPENPDAERVGQQVKPELMRLVSRGDAPAIVAPEPPPEEKPVPEPEPEQAPPPKPAPVANICVRWDRLSVAEAGQLTSRIGKKFPAYKLLKRNIAGEGANWWVFIPPLPGKDEVDKKTAELKQLGIGDYFIVQEAGPNHYAISLGVFSSEKGGKERLAEIRAKGVKSAQMSLRPGKDALLSLDASGPEPDKEALLQLTKAALPKAAPTECK